MRFEEFPFSKVHKCEIHPGIGIARVGNSSDTPFVGPENPLIADVPKGGYKDSEGRVRRQAARFRIYAFDGEGKNLGELPIAGDAGVGTTPYATVLWKVHVVNKKGAAHEFAYYRPDPKVLRNPAIKTEDRRSLIIDPKPRTVSGRNASGPAYQFTGGRFLGIEVPLGEIRTDEAGRLLVLGGFGHSGPVVPGIEDPDCPLRHYANNDNWHDDTSDGPVTATVTITLPGGKLRTIVAEGAWVIVAPPKFAPAIKSPVTLYEVIRDTAIRAKWLKDYAGKVDYYRDIYPLLLRAADIAWVNGTARRGHGYGLAGDYHTHDPESDGDKPRNINRRIDRRLLHDDALADPDRVKKREADGVATKIFERIRQPLDLVGSDDMPDEWVQPERPPADDQRWKQANSGYMPALSGDHGDAKKDDPCSWLTVLPRQYAKLKKWSQGDFVMGTKPTNAPPVPLESMTPDEQVAALQRAALEPCVGGAFNPGIEMTYIARWMCTFSGAFRIDTESHGPGDITQFMAVPWQADFYECNTNWWPAQRPDDVVPEELFTDTDRAWDPASGIKVSDGLKDRVKWHRGIGVTTLFLRPWQNPAEVVDAPDAADKFGRHDMIDYWSEFGFVEPRRARSGEIVHVEFERVAYAGMDTRRLFNALLNIEDNPTCLPKAREYVERVLKAARRVQQGPHAFANLDNIRPFVYSEDAFEERMQGIYEDTRTYIGPSGSNAFDPNNTPFHTRDDVIYRIIQLTPFNLLDGSWLRNIHRVGPVDDINAILYSILNEELGGGVPSQNHANIWLDLCQSVDFYPLPAACSEFAEDQRFLDAAFDSPTFQLAISEFTKSYYPEIIGMTLFLEWSVLVLHRTADMLDYFGMDAHFYRMHIAIDNAANGHGARIMRAVKLYLEQARLAGGDKAVQCQWRRIWDGYVAFSYTFSILINQITYMVSHPKEPKERLTDLITKKKPFGQLNHGDKKLGEQYLNDWFDQPELFLQELVTQGWIKPGEPDASPFFHLLGIAGGRRVRQAPVSDDSEPAKNARGSSKSDKKAGDTMPVEYEAGRMYRVFSDDEIKLWCKWVLSLRRKPVEAKGSAGEETPAGGVSLSAAERTRLKRIASERRTRIWFKHARKFHQAAQKRADKDAVATAGANYLRKRAQDYVAGCMVRVFTHLAFGSCGGLAYDELALTDPTDPGAKPKPFNAFIGKIRSAANPAAPARDLLAALKEARAAPKGKGGKNGFDRFVDKLRDITTHLGRTFATVAPGNDAKTGREVFDAWLEARCPLPASPKARSEPLTLDTPLDEAETHPTGVAFGFFTVH
jgi:hypothetical protein